MLLVLALERDWPHVASFFAAMPQWLREPNVAERASIGYEAEDSVTLTIVGPDDLPHPEAPV
jgi:hypothetical protein